MITMCISLSILTAALGQVLKAAQEMGKCSRLCLRDPIGKDHTCGGQRKCFPAFLIALSLVRSLPLLWASMESVPADTTYWGHPSPQPALGRGWGCECGSVPSARCPPFLCSPPLTSWATPVVLAPLPLLASFLSLTDPIGPVTNLD